MIFGADTTLEIRRLRDWLFLLSEGIGPPETTVDLVDVGSALAEISTRIDHLTGRVKAALRTLAENNGVEGKTVFRGTEGTTCSVTVPRPCLELRTDADVEMLRAVLGDRFDDLFVQVVVVKPRPGFEKETETLSETRRGVLMSAVDLKSETTRVSFEKPRKA